MARGPEAREQHTGNYHHGSYPPAERSEIFTAINNIRAESSEGGSI